MKYLNKICFKRVILFVVLFSIVLISGRVSAECSPHFTIYPQFKAFNADNSLELSKYQAPDYKEDDFLGFWRLYVSNGANCTSKNTSLIIKISNSEENFDYALCSYNLKIPPLEPGQTYSIVHDKIIQQNFSGDLFSQWNYLDSNGKNYTFCTIKMRTTGLWKTEIKWDPMSSGSYSMINDQNQHESLSFKVRLSSDIANEELQRKNIIIQLILMVSTIILALVGIIIQIYLSQWHIKKQQEFDLGIQRDLLEGIRTKIKVILGNINGHKTELNKGNLNLPSYLISTFEASFYIGKLKSMLLDQSTEKLKEILIEADDKIKTINRLVDLAQRDCSQRSVIIREIKKAKFTYHADLEELIKIMTSELEKFNFEEVNYKSQDIAKPKNKELKISPLKEYFSLNIEDLKSEFKEINYKLNLLREEVTLSSMDNVILALTILVISTAIAILFFGFSSELTSPVVIILMLMSLMVILVISQSFLGFVNSIFFEEGRFSNKINFLAILLSFILFLVLLLLIPYFLIKTFPEIYPLKGFYFYLLVGVVYGIPIFFWFLIRSKIRKFYLRKFANLFYEKIHKLDKEQRQKSLDQLDITYKDLKKLMDKK